jgi:hypothetical protein
LPMFVCSLQCSILLSPFAVYYCHLQAVKLCSKWGNVTFYMVFLATRKQSKNKITDLFVLWIGFLSMLGNGSWGRLEN